ncbi:MAG: DEAD/DEAH box helicase, partial [Candidatus Niameybacter stercoravium]|nr:DEAD/DEAH box helicase [Candidatus Niameybacter stercoravium]
MYAQVIINFAKTQEIDRLFTYSVPYTLLPKVRIGSRVKVPFGQGNHTQIGYVIHLSSNPPEEHYRIKPIAGLFDEIPVFNEEQIEIAKFLVNYYGCSFAIALEVMLPPGMSKKPYSSFEEAETYITLNIKPEVLTSYIESKAHMKSFHKQRAILMLFLMQASISLEDLKKSNEVSPSSLSTLIKNGILRKEEKLLGFRKDPIHYEYFKKLNLEQTYAKDQLLAAIGANRYEGVLLQGITGSGKTEVFLYAICKVLEEGGSAIVLVPEIALTRQTLMRFKERFGNVV